MLPNLMISSPSAPHPLPPPLPLPLSPSHFVHVYLGFFYFLRPVFLGQRIWNTLFLLALSIGQGIMVWLYSVEYYARLFCPMEVGEERTCCSPHCYTMYREVACELAVCMYGKDNLRC